MADHGEPARVRAQGAGQEVEPVGVEVVGGLVEEQDVVAGTEQARQPHAVALSHRQRLQWPGAVGAGAERTEGDVDAAFGVPGVEPGRGVQGGGEPVLGAGRAVGERRGRRIEFAQRRPRGGEGLRGQGADGLAGAGGHLLAGQGDVAGAVHDPRIGCEQARQDVQERGLAAPVLTDDGEPRAGGDGQRHAGEDAVRPAGDDDALGTHVGGRTGVEGGQG